MSAQYNGSISVESSRSDDDDDDDVYIAPLPFHFSPNRARVIFLPAACVTAVYNLIGLSIHALERFFSLYIANQRDFSLRGLYRHNVLSHSASSRGLFDSTLSALRFFLCPPNAHDETALFLWRDINLIWLLPHAVFSTIAASTYPWLTPRNILSPPTSAHTHSTILLAK